MAYTITLHFTAGDHSYTVLRDGYKLNRLVGAKGRHATQGCQLKIRSHEASILLLQEEAPLIRAELMEDEDLLFQGVVRPYQSVGARNNTLESFSLEILDDTEILTNTRITERADYFDKTLSWCIEHMYDMADLPEELVIPESADAISLAYFNVDPEMYPSVAEFLSALLFEYGLDYRFTGDQCQIIPTTVSGSSSLIPRAQLRNRFQISREDNWTDGIKVNYGVAEICSQIPLAWWKEDISEPAAWRYVLPWSYSDSSGHVTRTVSYEPFYGYPASQKPADFKTEYILSVMNCRATAERCTVLSLNPNARSIAIEFSWDQRQNYVWGNPIADWPYISVIGDIVYAIPGTYQEQIVGEKPDTFTLSFLRGQEGAKVFAEREYKRAKVAPTTYTFQSLAEHVPGAFYRIVDTVTGIDVVVRILSCATDADGICSIKAESADYIGMSVETENLKLRDNLDVGASVILTADKTLVSSGYATITATGRLMEIIDNEDPSTFRFTWEFNGSAKPEWTGMTQVLTYYSALETGANTVRIIVSHMEGGQAIELGSSSLTITKVVEGADGASAEIQYAIGSSITDPPMDEMLWNNVPMTWGGDPMLWQQGMWGDEVPEMQRGQYIWMRARVGDGPWQYTRLTGTTSWDAENLGICTTATPTTSSQGLGIIPGDYFVAGAQFTENGKTYYSGYAYYYTGTAWSEMNLETEEAAVKAQSLLDKLVSSNTQIPESSSSYSVWKWAKNFVSQNAVINNLFSQAITVLSGGYIKGGDRYNSSGQISDWSKKGFWLGADGTLMASLQSDGNGNTYVGTSVGANSNSPGSYNTAVGYAAMFKTTSGGDYNIAFGYAALYENQTGDNNTAIGYQALYSNTSGSYNIALGYQALYSCTSSGNNIAIGATALKSHNGTGGGNIALGRYSMQNTTSGYANIAIGVYSLSSNTSGIANIAIGQQAGNTTTGQENIAIGYNSNNYSPTGHRQMSFMSRLIYLEFDSTRTGGQIYDALHSYYYSNTLVGAIGCFNGSYVTGIDFSGSTINIITGSSATTLRSTTTNTYNGRSIFFFVNPYWQNAGAGNGADCLR